MASNSGDTGIKALLDSLQALYAKMSALIINKRINSYRKEGGAQLDTEILSALYDIVEKTPAAQSPRADNGDGRPATEAEGASTGESHRSPEVRQPGTAPATQHSDLSNHLHTNLSKTADSEHLGAKLKTSAWDHIHTSLRYVREGNAELARMHAGLANEALHQASHHMSDTEYVELKTAVLEELQKLRGY
ncbi:MAG: hypothetical protein KDI74_10250 [Gammaproteobacteria bacterium]|nr:hypothetical protein [Gammaproteobacteria bacterium]